MCMAFFLAQRQGKVTTEIAYLTNGVSSLQCTFLKSRGTSESQGLSALKSSLSLDFMLIHG